MLPINGEWQHIWQPIESLGQLSIQLLGFNSYLREDGNLKQRQVVPSKFRKDNRKRTTQPGHAEQK